MDSILRELGMSHLFEKFEENTVGPNEVLMLTDAEFHLLGVNCIGDKARLRQRCRQFVNGTAPDSPVVKQLKELTSLRKRKFQKQPSHKEPKKTRRLHIGWKHKDRNPGNFQLVPVSKGGGANWIDIPKEHGVQELQVALIEIFFPDGKAILKNLKKEDCSFFVASFTGNPLPEVLKDGSPFTIEAYYTEVKTSPIRIYLHSETKQSIENTDSDNDLPVVSMPRRRRRSRTTRNTNVQVVIDTTINDKSRDDRAVGNKDSDRGDVVVDADTPSIGAVVSINTDATNRNVVDVVTNIADGVVTATNRNVLEETATDVSTANVDLQESIPGNTGDISVDDVTISRNMPVDTDTNSIRDDATAHADAFTCGTIPTDDVAMGGAVANITGGVAREDSVIDLIVPTGSEEDDWNIPSSSGTPTVTFNRRRLSLRRHSTMNSEGDSGKDVENSSFDGPQNFTLKGILTWWTAKTMLDDQDKGMFVIQRGHVLKSTMRTIKRDTFNYCLSFTVHFSGEDGEDFGGPKREFLRLLMNEVQDECLQGHEGNKFFRHELEKIANKTYETAGSLVAFSILHGGPGLPVLHPSVYNFITSGNCESKTLPTIDECIFDCDQLVKFKAIQQASDEAAYAAALADISDWAFDQGMSLHNRRIEDKDVLMKLLIYNEICYRVHSEIDQFQRGLNKVGSFLEAVRLVPSEFQCLFTRCEKKLSFSQLRTMYKVQYSPQGSNKRIQENNAIYCLEAFLADCEGGASGVSLEEVLSFWTGASSLPPLGFDKNLEVSFGAEKRLPSAHTCSLVLNIWREYADPDMFATDMEKAIRWGGGFHLA